MKRGTVLIHTQTNVNTYTAPFFRGLTDDQCRLIHSASLEILERTGVFSPAKTRLIDFMTHANGAK